MSGDLRLIYLAWLAPPADIQDSLRRLAAEKQAAWTQLVHLANLRLDFVQTNRLDRALQKSLKTNPTDISAWSKLKLAILSSSTVEHLVPSIRIAALRRNLLLETF